MENVLIKVSGDSKDYAEFRLFTEEQAKTNYTVVILGGSTHISEALREAGYTVRFNEHGRVTTSWEERKIARDILEKDAKELEDKFIGKGVVVISPILYAGSVLCHINGDNLVKALYLGFDKIYVFTLKERFEAKKSVFKYFPNVTVKPL